MRTINGNYTPGRVGFTEDRPAGIPGRPFFVKQGEEFVATEADAKKWGLVEGRAYQTWRWPGYPIVIDQDTEFRDCNFAQVTPHTEIFTVVAGPFVTPVVRFVDCNLVNVKVPDGAEIEGGNLAQIVRAPTGDANRPETNLLCECLKCCTAVKVLRQAIAARDKGAFDGTRWKHHVLKPRYTEARKDAALVQAARDERAAENLAAMQKFGRTVTLALRSSLKRGQ